MTDNWNPKQENQALIAMSIEFITDGLVELQKAIDCPNSFIFKLLNKLICQYQTNQKIARRD